MRAGVFANEMVTTGDGYELTWQVNVLAPYVLGALLVNAVKERMINVSSISAGSRIDFDNLNQVSPHHAQQLCARGVVSLRKSFSRRIWSLSLPSPSSLCIESPQCVAILGAEMAL